VIRNHLDFETFGRVDLTKVGAPLYAKHPDTGIHCVSFHCQNAVKKLYKGNPENWGFGEPIRKIGFANTLVKMATDPEIIFVAHGAMFEQSIWQYILVEVFGYPPIPIERWRCTMAKCLAWGLPASLKDAAKVLQLPAQKDMEGRDTMLRLARPRKNGDFWTPKDKPIEFQQLYSYCDQDVECERQLDIVLPDLTPDEQEVWFADQHINQQGIYLDIPAVRKAMEFNKQYDKEQQKRFVAITGGIPSVSRQRTKIQQWLHKQGVMVSNTQRSTLQAELYSERIISPDVRTVMEVCISSGRTSTSKYEKMIQRTDEDNCTRELLQYHGAHTGRWSGRGIQIQNLLRPTVNPNVALKVLQEYDYEFFKFMYPDVADALASCLRRVIVSPPGCTLIGADFSQIEARVLAWLAGESKVLDAFRAGEDLYCKQASTIYGFYVSEDDKERRALGKVAVLALGYQGGIGAFVTMSRNTGVSIAPVHRGLWSMATDSEREKAEYALSEYYRRTHNPIPREVGLTADLIKQRWRNANPNIVNYWHRTEAAVKEVISTGKSQRVNDVVWHLYTRQQRTWLVCRLPSGRPMVFYNPRITHNGEISYVSPKYGRTTTYGGELVENIVQAVARDVMKEAMFRVAPIATLYFTVHDELICYVRTCYYDEEYQQLFDTLIAKSPTFAQDLPVAMESWSGVIYSK
jgi:DNA polymerase